MEEISKNSTKAAEKEKNEQAAEPVPAELVGGKAGLPAELAGGKAGLPAELVKAAPSSAIPAELAPPAASKVYIPEEDNFVIRI
jgi:hypothetical protein